MSGNANLQITEEKLKELKQIKTASFAVWLDNDKRKEYVNNNIKENIGTLKSNVILLGLNPSKSKLNPHKKLEPFCNFHDGSEVDIFLRDTIFSKCNALIGAYMTDISQKEQSKSKKIKASKVDIRIFKKQLKILKADEYFVVCFGDEAFNTFKASNGFVESSKGKKTPKSKKSKKKNKITKSVTLGDCSLHCYKVLHYSHIERFPKKKRKFISQLRKVNDLISKKLSR